MKYDCGNLVFAFGGIPVNGMEMQVKRIQPIKLIIWAFRLSEGLFCPMRLSIKLLIS